MLNASVASARGSHRAIRNLLQVDWKFLYIIIIELLVTDSCHVKLTGIQKNSSKSCYMTTIIHKENWLQIPNIVFMSSLQNPICHTWHLLWDIFVGSNFHVFRDTEPFHEYLTHENLSSWVEFEQYRSKHKIRPQTLCLSFFLSFFSSQVIMYKSN